MKKKKAYAKPVIYMEEFGVSQSIATCKNPTNTFYKDQGCSIQSSDDFDQVIYYFDTDVTNTKCKTPVSWSEGDKPCYDIPQDFSLYFGS